MKTLHSFMSRSRKASRLLISVLPGILLLILSMAGLARAAAPPDPAGQLCAAWQQAQATGYRFEAQVQQTLIPRPVWKQWGRSDEQVNFYLEGELERLNQPTAPDSAAFRTHTRVWPQVGRPHRQVADGVAVLNPGAVEPMMEIVQEGDRATVRQAGQEARTVQVPTSLVAPQGDFLAYLEAAQDVEQIADCRLASGTCYRFRIDGPRFAEPLRQRLEREYAADLPPDAHLAPSPLFQKMGGQGELWVDAHGFPVRQVLDLEFPQVSEEYGAKARVTADFTSGKETGTQVPRYTGRQADELPGYLGTWVPVSLCTLLVCGLVVYRRRKKVYAAVVVLVIASMVGGPLYSVWRMERFVQMRTAEAAGGRQPTTDDGRQTTDGGGPSSVVRRPSSDDEAVQTFFKELQEAMRPSSALPGFALGEPPPGRDPRLAKLLPPDTARLLDVGAGLVPAQTPPRGGCYRKDDPAARAEDKTDNDQDGLCDGYESEFLGTSPIEADTDQDLVTDTLEVEGFTFAGRQWYTNPLLADSNQDGRLPQFDHGQKPGLD